MKTAIRFVPRVVRAALGGALVAGLGLGACYGSSSRLPARPAEPFGAPSRVHQVRNEWFRGVMGKAIGSWGLWVGDLDGDETQEIVTSGQVEVWGRQSWYVLRKASSGGYEQAWVSDPLAKVTTLAVADVDGDGDKDIVVAAGTRLYVYDGSGFGLLYQVPTIASELDGILTLAIADVDTDGSLEYVMSDRSDIFVYAVSSRSFERRIGGLYPRSVAVGDVDGQPGQEIVVAGSYDGFVLDGATGDPKWTLPGINGISPFGVMVRAGDLDGDGTAEIVTAFFDISVYDGATHALRRTIHPHYQAEAVRLIDVDGDGAMEIVYGDDQFGSLYVHDGATGSLRETIPNPGWGVSDVAIGDTDGDGSLEVVWGVLLDDGPHVYVADMATGSVEWKNDDIVGPFPAFDFGDLDGDGTLQIVYGNFGGDDGYGEYYVHDAVTKDLQYRSPLTNPFQWTGFYRFAHANVDADPQQELFASISIGGNDVLICWDGLDHTEQWRNELVPDGPFRSLEVADLDLDGSLELVVGASQNGVFRVFDAATGTEKWHGTDPLSSGRALVMLRLGNIDSDPQLEIVFGEFQGGVFVYDGLTHQVQSALARQDVTSLDVVDQNGDGRQEVYVGTMSGSIDRLDPVTGAVLTHVGSYGGIVQGLDFAEVVGGPPLDFAFVVNQRVQLYDGSSPGTPLWTSPIVHQEAGMFDTLRLADIDGDGNVEIVANVGPNGLRMWEILAHCEDDGQGPDCNGNKSSDRCDVEDARSSDCNHDGVPDECQLDGDGDGVMDPCDNCPALSNAGQDDEDGDGLGDACDAFPDRDLYVRIQAPPLAIAGVFFPLPAFVTYRLENSDGTLASDLANVKFRVTASGGATFLPQALQGVLLEGGGTNSALIGFVDGLALLSVTDPVVETAVLSGADPEGQGVRLRAETFDDFESDDGAFVHSGPNDRWKRGAPGAPFPSGAHSGANAWTITLTGDHGHADAVLTSRAFKVTSPQGIVLELWSATPRLDNPDSADIELSTDDRTTWLPVFRTPYYQADPTNRLLSLDLSDYPPGLWRFRFRLTSEYSDRSDWSIDDVRLRGAQDAASIRFLHPGLDEDDDGLLNVNEDVLHTDPLDPDTDDDTVLDVRDDCPLTPNTGQEDLDLDGTGDACEQPLALREPQDGTLFYPDSEPATFGWFTGVSTQFKVTWSARSTLGAPKKTSGANWYVGDSLVPSPTLWLAILKLAKTGGGVVTWQVKSKPPTGTILATETRTVRLSDPIVATVIAPADDQAFVPAGPAPTLQWDANHNDTFRVTFGSTPDLRGGSALFSSAGYTLTGSSWTIPASLWSQIASKIASRSAEGRVYYAITARDRLGRKVVGRVRSFRITGAVE